MGRNEGAGGVKDDRETVSAVETTSKAGLSTWWLVR